VVNPVMTLFFGRVLSIRRNLRYPYGRDLPGPGQADTAIGLDRTLRPQAPGQSDAESLADPEWRATGESAGPSRAWYAGGVFASSRLAPHHQGRITRVFLRAYRSIRDA